jgi:hypothetical protein
MATASVASVTSTNPRAFINVRTANRRSESMAADYASDVPA